MRTYLKSQQEANDTRNKKERPDQVQLGKLLPESQLLPALLRDLEQKGQYHQCEGSNRQVQVEAPSPRHLVREDATE